MRPGPSRKRTINDWADLEVVYGIYEDIAIGLCSVEDSPVKTQELETHDLAIAPVGLQQEAWLVSQPGEDGAEQREASWTWWRALRHRSYPFKSGFNARQAFCFVSSHIRRAFYACEFTGPAGVPAPPLLNKIRYYIYVRKQPVDQYVLCDA